MASESAEKAKKCRQRTALLERELDAMKGSRVWRTAVSLKGLLNPGRTKTSAGNQQADGREAAYREFLARNELTAERRRAQEARIEKFARKPLISIVTPVHNTEPDALQQAVESVLGQIYQEWELCLVDDGSGRVDTRTRLDRLKHPKLKLKRLQANRNISAATNEGIAMAEGDYLAFLDHDDQLAPDALLEVAAAINETGADFLYTDEDHLDLDGRRTDPHFKPDYSPDLLLSHNYITHFVVASRALVERTGGLRSEFDGAQDYDFVLRATEQAEKIIHIPKVLYHWRMSHRSTAMIVDSKPEAAERGRLVLEQALKRRGGATGIVVGTNLPYFYRVRYKIRKKPTISIIIPFKDQPDLLQCIVGDILDKSTYVNYEIVAVNNGSRQEETFAAIRDLRGLDDRVRFIDYDKPFSFSAIVNHGAAECKGSHIVFMNNDIRLITSDWLEALLEHSQRGETGAVGGKLYYPDGRVQHAGVIVGIGGYAGHSHKGFPGNHQGYLNRLQVVQNVSAVTGAFMMVEKGVYTKVGGFDEANFAIACNDVDFCLRLREKGYWNVFTPYAEAYHIESASRGYEDTPGKASRFAKERELFAQRHRRVLELGDPFYNSNLTDTAEDFSLRASTSEG